jgi:hypothetical protein
MGSNGSSVRSFDMNRLTQATTAPEDLRRQIKESRRLIEECRASVEPHPRHPLSPPDARMMNFRPTDRLTGFLMPPSVDERLPEKHLARFVVEVLDGPDLSAMTKTAPAAY